MKLKTPFLAGVLGGGIIIAVFLIVLFSVSLFNFRIQIEQIHINAATIADTTYNTDADSIIQQYSLLEKQLMSQLKKEKLILTPQEYTNNIVNYYNTILLILSVMLAAFSALSFVYIRSQSKDLIQDTLQSNEFQEEVGSKLLGKAESRFREELSQLQDKIKQIDNRLADSTESEEDNNDKELE